ncbi:transcriptional regulator with XRE-family HTH domain [Microbacterium natoriense]|uniref:Transcriptional regulator with XRE-family HTH domain n=1 Tax=Microbacterium natoriense TaxID=284570 RepID=A0AAW8EYQ4_9MICO|nr:helix-turn-helix transcriptional regulator [Microbacterium natoriense]MDQ0648600.1 transcriptional regulator with XRE-family HTH domain [Microbacterium natoriense]
MPETPGEVFARRLRRQRLEAGIAQTELALRMSRLLGGSIDGSAITRIEKMDRAVRLDEAVAAARALNVPLDALINDEESGESRLRELREELGRQQSRADAAIAEHQQAVTAMVDIEQEIKRLAALREA